MDREDLLVKTSDGKSPKPCSDYDEETGLCKSDGKPCDACYEDRLREWFYWH